MVEAQLGRDPQLQRDLEILARSLHPLTADRDSYDPPAGLAHRTCEFVAVQGRAIVTPAAAVHVPGRWSFADVAVAAGIFIAAAMLFFPAMNQSRFAARVAGCQNNLRQIGVALSNYSLHHQGYFPSLENDEPAGSAGIYATRLLEQGLIDNREVLVCPASQLADNVSSFHVPTMTELRRANGSHLARLQQQMGGSYGYNIGYRTSGGGYHATKNLNRANFAIMADMPTALPPFHSANHGGRGQNVLFEDQHVAYMTTCKARGCDDNIYTNDAGQVDAGLHLHDAVIGHSTSKPVLIIRIRPVR